MTSAPALDARYPPTAAAAASPGLSPPTGQNLFYSIYFYFVLAGLFLMLLCISAHTLFPGCLTSSERSLSTS